VHLTDSRHHAGARRLAVVLVVGHQEADLEEPRADVAQRLDALARRELSLLVLSGHLVGAAAGAQRRLELAHRRAELPQS